MFFCVLMNILRAAHISNKSNEMHDPSNPNESYMFLNKYRILCGKLLDCKHLQKVPRSPNVGADDDCLVRSVIDCYTNSSYFHQNTNHSPNKAKYFIQALYDPQNKEKEKLQRIWQQLHLLLKEKQLLRSVPDCFKAAEFAENLLLETERDEQSNQQSLNGQLKTTSICKICKTFHTMTLRFALISVDVFSEESIVKQLKNEIRPIKLGGLSKRESFDCKCPAEGYKMGDEIVCNEYIKLHNLLVLSARNQLYQEQKRPQQFELSLAHRYFGNYRLHSFVLYSENQYSSVIYQKGKWILGDKTGIYDVSNDLPFLLQRNIRLAFYDKISQSEKK